MNIIACKKYNELEMRKWHKAVEEWKGELHPKYIPSLAFYGFRNRNGELKKSGFVLLRKGGASWFKTRREALQ